jgi:uncharacterized membrane protein YeiH
VLSFFTTLAPEVSALAIPVWLDLAAVVVGGINGVLTACDRKLDLVGAVGLSIVCGLGGGLIRDITMQTGHVYMLESPYAIVVAVICGIVVFYFHGAFSHIDHAIAWVDIISVGLFAALGTDKAVMYDLLPVNAVLMGTLTGVGGGMLRDIFLGDIPHIFRPSHLYALCAVSGSAVYYAAVVVGHLSKPWAVAACVIVTVALRTWSLRCDIKSPAGIDLTPKVVEPVRKARETLHSDTVSWHMGGPHNGAHSPADEKDPARKGR